MFSCLAEDHSGARLERLGVPAQTGTFCLSAKAFLGPYLASDEPVAAPDHELGTLYAGKLLEGEPGKYMFMAFRGDGDRGFIGELTDPLPVRHDDNGHIRLATDR